MSTPDFTAIAKRPGAFQARKRPVVVDVVFAEEDGVLQTREGPVRYVSGDALLTAQTGERWPIERKRFLRTYEPGPETTSGKTGRYIKRPAVVWAWRVDRATDVPLPGCRGTLRAEPGDIIVQYASDDFGVVGEQIFAQTYDTIG